MKVVQFLDSDRDIDGEAASVATWSVRKNGSLPTDTQYILYTVNERHFNNPIVNAVFDVIARPPYDEEWLNNIDWEGQFNYKPPKDNYNKEYRVRGKFWGKFLSFLNTPCDNSFVMHIDWDIICRASLLGSLPPHGKAWSAYCVRELCTNGFMVKSQKFDDLGIGNVMKEPLSDPELYERMHKIIPSADEIGTTWYRQQYGDDTLHKLRRVYCGNVAGYINNDIPLSDNNDRILHYVLKTKPWQGFVSKDNPYVKLWWDVHDEMIRSI